MSEMRCPTCKGSGVVPDNRHYRDKRLQLGLSVAALAQLSGLSAPYIGEIESGKKPLSASARVKLDRALEGENVHKGGFKWPRK